MCEPVRTDRVWCEAWELYRMVKLVTTMTSSFLYRGETFAAFAMENKDLKKICLEEYIICLRQIVSSSCRWYAMGNGTYTVRT
mmetsp:Transcript_80816/g.121456  ORF Transcript_80816/g.121456 Transcript_80816/m.121456 type:complete len:83 (+) Transcript_80816:214-462(+)